MPKLTTREQVLAKGTAPDTGLTQEQIDAYLKAKADLQALVERERTLRAMGQHAQTTPAGWWQMGLAALGTPGQARAPSQVAAGAAREMAGPYALEKLQIEIDDLQKKILAFEQEHPDIFLATADPQQAEEALRQSVAERLASGKITREQAAREYAEGRERLPGLTASLTVKEPEPEPEPELFDPARPWWLPGMTEQEEAYARAATLGVPTPWEEETMQWARQDRERQAAQARYDAVAAEWERQQRELEAQRQWQQQQAALAMRGWQETFPYYVSPGREYAPGFEPGGPVARIYEMGGMQFDPEMFRPQPMRPVPGLGAMPQAGEYQGQLEEQMRRLMPQLVGAAWQIRGQ
jgi:hypothetical protein